jgi:hypothetical protein
MGWLSKLFGGKAEGEGAVGTPAEFEEYKGFRITPKPIREGSQYRIAAKIEKDGRVHELIRADTMGSLDDATAISAGKARQIIDEQGERLFG